MNLEEAIKEVKGLVFLKSSWGEVLKLELEEAGFAAFYRNLKQVDETIGRLAEHLNISIEDVFGPTPVD